MTVNAEGTNAMAPVNPELVDETLYGKVDERLELPEEKSAQLAESIIETGRVATRVSPDFDPIAARRFEASATQVLDEADEPLNDDDGDEFEFPQEPVLGEAKTGKGKSSTTKKNDDIDFSQEVRRAQRKEARLQRRKRFFSKLKLVLTLGFHNKTTMQVFANLDVILNVLLILSLLFFIAFGAYCLITERFAASLISALFVVIMKNVAGATKS